ncbi:Superfamily II DNA or RNA helicase, SNF2 family [Cellulosimicrobium aquatile]|uniref:Superfamily II DNA or RNA helicase, SNF2 family n=2 Tax=Cellulosimicrobium aquatile TaxID=1612203 RepID=A0A1N6SYE2_9MICO|nr:Superfamily II DNA or RNA helicase, SNF2 family [Cellulosimicrobium aquatile]
MGLKDMLSRLRMRPDDETAPMRRFQVSFDDDGANFVTTPEDLGLLRQGDGQRSTQEQFLVLEMMEEAGAALPLPNGYAVRSRDVAAMGPEEAAILGLPPLLPGRLEPKVRHNTTSRHFDVSLRVVLEDGDEPCRRTGPVVTIGSETRYRLSPRALRVIRAVERHAALEVGRRTEADNVRLIAEIQAAQRDAAPLDGVSFSLGHIDEFSTVSPASVSLLVEEQPDGSLAISPDLGAEVDPSAVSSRRHHVEDEGPSVLRVGNQLVMLEEDQAEGVREVLRRPHIPAEEKQDFYRAPGDFYDPTRVDVDLHFGVRVAGIGVIVPQTFTDASESGISWFGGDPTLRPTDVLAGLIDSLPRLEQVERDVTAAREAGRTAVAVGDQVVDIGDERATAAALHEARDRLEEEARASSDASSSADADAPAPEEPARRVQVGVHVADAQDVADALRGTAVAARPIRPVDYDSLARSPYPHQRDGVEWMAALMAASTRAPESSATRVQGAVLADDMGLGKTYMTLVALRELMAAERALGEDPRPTLAVLPVALIENWEAELAATFPELPFGDVVVLQGGRDLPRFRLAGAGRETTTTVTSLDERGMMRDDAIRFSLRVGPDHGDRRLDVPGRLVLTTYDTLRSYQLSLAQVDWGTVVFDEAQTVKNPDTLATRAAKALKARFKLLATGTPVENSMLDFWCLMDTAQPGLLGSWSDFRSRWVAPMKDADPQEKMRIGEELRALVGPFMLRRVKEDHLADLPPKTVYGPEEGPSRVARPDLGVPMPAGQREVYDDVLRDYQRSAGAQGAALKAVQGLRAVSLHPAARGDGELGTDPGSLALSARMTAALEVLDAVRDKGEKAIVFVINKKVQRSLALWLQDRYGLPVSVVNGDTAAVSTGSSPTRKRIIERFEQRPGFNVIIMSPLAVGVGLTVVGANHAIHLERHWNPAKEAQATDRIYRIGQTRPVSVYLPAALHPDMTSFDLNLDRLLQQKTILREAIVVPEKVTEDELADALTLDPR